VAPSTGDRPTRKPLPNKASHLTPPPQAASVRKLGLWTILLAVCGLFTGCYTIHAALPPQAAGLPFDSTFAVAARRLIPQGWAFFTADPRTTFLLPYQQIDGEWAEVGQGPLALPRNAFGLDRSPRLQNRETAALATQGRPELWVPCPPGPTTGVPGTCLDQAAELTGEPSRVVNTAADPTVCGPTVLVTMRPAAWPPTTPHATLVAQSAIALDVGC